ncbi:MAG: CBS domain-containing protein [Alphaproteobacteria bacterium]|nr:CBS domain-containing protein [Alphaproteobacteria bacterium]
MVLHGPARAFMTPDVDTLPYDAPVSAVRALLRDHAYHHVPIVDGDRVAGLLSALDLARVSLEAWGTDAATTDAHLDARFSIVELMTVDPEVVQASDDIHRAAELLAEGTFHCVPVVDSGRLVGVITSTDILRAVLAT